MRENVPEPIRFGPFLVDLHTHELRKDSIRIRLVGQPFAILAELLSRPGELVTREELRLRLWPGDTFVDFDHGLNAAVNKLREALGDSADEPRYIETLPRRGYRFMGKMETGSASVELPVPLTPSPAANQPVATSRDVPVLGMPRTPRAYFRWAFGVGALLVASLIVFGALSARKRLSAAAPPPPRITEFTLSGDSASGPSFSPDGKFIAYERYGGNSAPSGIFAQAIGSNSIKQLSNSERDCCAVWSPDGRAIAFARIENNEIAIFLVSVDGRPERHVEIRGAPPKMALMDWSPDGKVLALSSGASLATVSLEDFSMRQLTAPPPLTQDWGPSFSANGKMILFARSSEMGFPEQILQVPTSGGDATLISTEVARLRGSPRWSADGHSVIFASDRGGKPALWRVSAESKEPAIQFNDGGSNPVVSRSGNRLAYQRQTRNLTVWESDLSGGRNSDARALIPLTSQTDQGPGPQYSPDGKRIAYMSDRSGAMEIWVSDRDGTHSKQLTSIGNAGTPRWSPDGQAVVFDANRKRGTGIYSVSVNGGPPRLMTQDEFENRCPSWSRDGKWIYFASTRSGRWQVWKVGAGGGAAVQVTTRGGHAPLESADGKSVYYAKNAMANPQIWQIPRNGGSESPVSPLVRPPSWASWAVVEQGILFAESPGEGGPVVRLFDMKTRRAITLGSLAVAPFWLTATGDGKYVAVDRPGWQESQIMLMENFH